MAKQRAKKYGHGGARPGAGKPPSFIPTPEQRHVVSVLAGFQRPLTEIARLIINDRTKRAISTKVLERAFAEEIAAGAARFNAELAHAAHALIKARNVPMTIFSLKSRFGWSENIQHTHLLDRNPDQSETHISVHFVEGEKPVTLDHVAEPAPAGTKALEDLRPEQLDQRLAKLRADQEELNRLERLRSDRTLVPPLGDREWPGS
jgi:hypothetical protein